MGYKKQTARKTGSSCRLEEISRKHNLSSKRGDGLCDSELKEGDEGEGTLGGEGIT